MQVYFFSILRSHNCGIIFTRFHASIQKSRRFYVIVYWLCETLVEHPTSFVETSQKSEGRRASNNISERRCELKANEPVNERGK